MLPTIQATFSNPHSGLPVLGRILPPSQLISCGGGIWATMGSFISCFLGCLWLAGRVCKRKDILLILVINPLVISETGAKIVRRAQDAPASISPSLHSPHQPLIFPNFPYFIFQIKNKADGAQTYLNAGLCLTRDLQPL